MRDMTVGPAQGHLWRYALPVLLGNWLQLAYNAVDSIIAGRFIGKEALAAEGIAAPVMNLVILAVSGLCIGAGVLMSEYFGAGKWERLRQSMGTMLLFGAVVSVILAAACIVLAPYLLYVMDVPSEIFEMTVIYLRITFVGFPFTFFYNALSAGLKSVGDSKTPLKFLAFSAVLNAVLDLLFLGVFRFGIVCSAVTTVVAEGCSAVLAAGYLVMRTKELCPTRQQWRIEKKMLQKILSYGAPTALQQAAQPIGKVLIQGQVNGLGVTTIAAFQTVTKVDDFACIPEQGIAAGSLLLDADWSGDIFLPGADCFAVCCRRGGGRGSAFRQSVFVVYVPFLSVAGIYQWVSGIFQRYGENVYNNLRDSDSDHGTDGVYISSGACYGDCRDCDFLPDWVVGHVII